MKKSIVRFLKSKINPLYKLEKKTISQYGYALQKKSHAIVDREGQPIPWYTYPAIEYLKQFDFSDKSVFEFGCGYSSLFWEKRAKKVVSVENNKAWYDKMRGEQGENLDIIFAESKEAYVNSILNEGQFDVIVVDGEWRDLCAENAIKKIKHDGIIIFDNSERVQDLSEYKRANDIFTKLGFIQVDFMGIGPLNDYAWATTMFMSREIQLKKKTKYIPVHPIGGITEKE